MHSDELDGEACEAEDMQRKRDAEEYVNYAVYFHGVLGL